MYTQLLILPLPFKGHTVLNLSQPLADEALPDLAQALTQTLEQLNRGGYAATPTPGELEYASWTPVQRH